MTLKNDDLLVSCLMVTLPSPTRLAYVRRSIAGYLSQTHPKRELLVVVNGGTAKDQEILVDYVGALGRDDIRTIKPAGDLSLGELRNISMAEARGDVVCQWDDDDLQHPDRLAAQLGALIEGEFEANYLQDVVQYLPRLRALYWTNWRATEAGAHPGTLMAHRSTPIRYPIDGANARLGEDTEVALALSQRGALGRLEGNAHLFVYVSHGANSWSDDHHHMLAQRLSISRGLLARREDELRRGLAPFGFEEIGVVAYGSNGAAFEIAASSPSVAQ